MDKHQVLEPISCTWNERKKMDGGPSVHDIRHWSLAKYAATVWLTLGQYSTSAAEEVPQFSLHPDLNWNKTWKSNVVQVLQLVTSAMEVASIRRNNRGVESRQIPIVGSATTALNHTFIMGSWSYTKQFRYGYDLWEPNLVYLISTANIKHWWNWSKILHRRTLEHMSSSIHQPVEGDGAGCSTAKASHTRTLKDLSTMLQLSIRPWRSQNEAVFALRLGGWKGNLFSSFLYSSFFIELLYLLFCFIL